MRARETYALVCPHCGYGEFKPWKLDDEAFACAHCGKTFKEPIAINQVVMEGK
jgi:hypothetical protein